MTSVLLADIPLGGGVVMTIQTGKQSVEDELIDADDLITHKFGFGVAHLRKPKTKDRGTSYELQV